MADRLDRIKVEIVRRKRAWRGQRWFWRVRAMNNETLCTSELYANEDDARDTAMLVTGATVVERVDA